MQTIPIQLAGHYASRATSLTLLVKMRCKDGTILAFTKADHDITYTDGPDGPILYPCLNGVSESALDMTSDLSVDNAMMYGIVQANGITEQQIRSGIFTSARFWVYEVNYLDLSMGHRIWGSGFSGATSYSENQFRVELRMKTQRLKQPISEMYTLECPVAYGSAPCGKTFEWSDTTVDTVDPDEPDRVFTVNGGMDWPEDTRFQDGVMQVVTGDNAGAEVDVEIHEDDSIELLLALPYPLAPDDELRFRIDCNKEARDEVHGCKSELRWGDAWIDHHRGFPDIPVASAQALLSPGAQTKGNGGGVISMGTEQA